MKTDDKQKILYTREGKSIDVYLDSFVNVPMTIDWKEVATKKFIEMLNSNQADFDYQIYDNIKGEKDILNWADDKDKEIEKIIKQGESNEN